jgi:hypothetical protein
MSTKKRDVIWGGRIMGAEIRAQGARGGRSEGHAPPVHMIKLTEKQTITPYKWVHPDEER